MSKKLKILVTGASGLLGGTMVDAYRSHYSVVGLYRTHPISVTGASIRKANILDIESLNGLFRETRPDIVIHCASLTNVDQCELEPELTERVNVVGTRNVVDVSNEVNAKFIYISTDSVYSGERGNYEEADATAPRNVYGQTKLKGESEAMRGRDALVIRTNIFGWNIIDKCSLGEWILLGLQRGEVINGFADAIFSSIYTYELVKIIEQSIQKGATGLYNCGSHDSCSKYQFATKIASRFGHDDGSVVPSKLEQSEFIAQRGKDLSMNICRIEEMLGRKLPTIDECIDQFYNDYLCNTSERLKKWRGK